MAFSQQVLKCNDITLEYASTRPTASFAPTVAATTVYLSSCIDVMRHHFFQFGLCLISFIELAPGIQSIL